MAKRTLRVGYPGNYREIEVDSPDAEPAPWDADSKLAVVGKRSPRLEGADKVTGKAKYTADVKLQGMLVARVLRSPYARATARSIGLAKALKMPGVKAAIEVEKEARYHGQAIAAVAAETEAQAEDAVAAIEVDWAVGEHVVDVEAARKPNAPRVHGGKNPNERGGEAQNTATEEACVTALKKSHATVDITFTTPVVTHSCLESHGSVARWESDGSLTVWDSTQSIFGVRDGLARGFQLPAEKVRVVKEHMGGGFGSKLGMGQHSMIAARLAREAKAPVKLMLTRKEEHLAGGNRPSSVQRVRAGADKDGKLTCLWLQSHGTGGINGGANCAGPLMSLYNCPVRRLWHADVITNASPAAAFRAPGHVQGMFALESTMDELAGKLGLDPIEFRKRNDQNEMRQAEYGEGAKMAGWEARAHLPNSGGRHKARGLGVSASIWGGGGAPGAQARCVISRDGAVEIQCGTQDIGTGTRTIIAMIAAEELGLKPEQVLVKLGDTTLPFSHGSGGSMTAPSVTPAVRAATAAARGRVFEACAKSLKADADNLTAKGGNVVAKGGASIPWAEACSKIAGANVSEQATRAQNFRGYKDGTAGCQFAEVEVDLETGHVQVLRVVAVHDCGRVVNPLLAESQINGGIIQGLSYALLEQRILDDATGRMMNANFSDYRIAGPKEIPEISVVLFDVSNGRTNTGVMGIGEPPIVPTPAAIANAVAHAIGKRITDLPITPDKILAALGKK
ncbi:MAG: aerobic-type carbon monoxide dehydrogenase large subunit CoxL/CutL-like [Planctomycetota bacterium]|nr:MAG: aerobic-type carbon monoxide dehydrogenase large subunit CoxL/CutL-like [Planctomycetota bacterium]